MKSTFLTAEWRKLLMAQYEVRPAKLMPYMPAGLDLDLFQDRCYVSLIGFLFDRVRVKGIAFPFHTSFEEVNLRFYVHRREADGSIKRGVVFVREFVPRRAIAFVAQRFYEEPYLAIPTRREIRDDGSVLNVDYRWKFGGRWHSFSASAATQTNPIAAGSIEEFITEHYWGYTRRSDGSTSAYQVEHPRWETHRLHSYEIAVDLGILYGERFKFVTEQPVSSVFLAEGSAVSVSTGTRLPAARNPLPS